MTFFNKKEEVLDIKLTQFGKQLLSMGKLKPVYYAFFDDNVLYDGAAGRITEEQNNIEPRIQEGVMQNKTQHVFSSIENTFSKYLDQRTDPSISEIDRVRVQADTEKNYSLTGPLGNSNLESQTAPAWKITVLEGEIQNSVYFLTGAYQDLRIPQVDLNITYTTKVLEEEDVLNDAENLDLSSGMGNDGTPFEDGSVIDIGIKNALSDLMIMVEESEVDFQKENFEMEIYYIEPSDSSLTPLSFVPKSSNIVDGLLITESPTQKASDIDKSFAEFYFDLNIDSEISKQQICEAIGKIKANGIYIDSPIECEGGTPTPTTINPYYEGALDPFCKDE
jgi:hypothetical protein